MDSRDECILDQENLWQAQSYTKGWNKINVPRGTKFPIRMMRFKLIGLSGRELCYTMGDCVGIILTLKRTPILTNYFSEKSSR